jgi:hypothetical protein
VVQEDTGGREDQVSVCVEGGGGGSDDTVIILKDKSEEEEVRSESGPLDWYILPTNVWPPPVDAPAPSPEEVKKKKKKRCCVS